MSSRKVEFSVGLFVAAGLAIAIILVVWLGFNKYFAKGDTYYTFFDESVQGLNVDSPVTFRGVRVGRVTDVALARDFRLIQVTIQVESSTITNPRGMVAQMRSVGITGSAFVDLDMNRPKDEDLIPDFASELDHPVIPSKPSTMTMIVNRLEELSEKIDEIDFDELSASAKKLFDSAGKFMTELEEAHLPNKMSAAMAKVDATLDISQQTMARVDKLVVENGGAISETLRNVAIISKDGTKFSAAGAKVITHIEALTVQGKRLMQKLELLGNDMVKILNILVTQPSMIIFSDPAEDKQ